MKADLVVFDAAAIVDRATYTEPFRYPVGVEHVLVNGELTVQNAEHLGIRAGKVLRLNL
jgi:N-acyl-D-amino-acid deacylase